MAAHLRVRRAYAGITAVPVVLLTAIALLVAPLAPAHANEVGGPALDRPGVVVGTGGSPLPTVSATSWVVADATTGEVLAAKSAHLRHRPASTLKTLTAVTLMPYLDPTAEHEVSSAELAPVYGSRAGIVADATYTIDDLWHALLLPSGNDAAAALAGAYGGVKKTVRAMNAKAAELQAHDTRAVNPSGLDAGKQFTTAYDLALIARAALALPEFVQVSGTVSYDLPGRMVKAGKKRPTFKIYGQNRLLNDGYRGVIAGKTGYTTLAGRTFWVAAKRGGRTVLVTLMGITEATETAAAKLLTWGLRNDGRTTPVGTLVNPVSAPATGADDPANGEGLGTGATGAAAPVSPPDAAAESTGPGTPLLVAVVIAALLLLLLLAARRRNAPASGRGGAEPEPAAPAAREPAEPAVVPPPAAPVPPAPAPDPVGPPPRSPRADQPTGNVRIVRPPHRRD